MATTIIWLTILGIALLVPNVLAVRLAVLGIGDAPASASVSTVAAAAVSSAAAASARPTVKRGSPKFVRGGYLWKALSPLVLGICYVLGLAVGGVPGYVIMGLGLLNVLVGSLGWDAYIPGKMGKKR